MKIGFLLNHEQVHQVPHCVPIAFELSRLRPDLPVHIIASSDDQLEQARRFAARFPDHRCQYDRIRIPRWLELASKALRGVAPLSKVAMLRHNAAWLDGFDALVVPEKTTLMLRTRFGATRPRLIHTRHGAGDRAIGFDEESRAFDMALFSGKKIEDRLRDAGCLPERHAIVGYPKFDAVGALDRKAPDLFGNGRKTVLYAPHPSPHLSSWYRYGPRIVDFFLESSDYNLIFAPHIMLFERSLTLSIDRFSLGRPGKLDPRWEACDHILVDRGSPASADMTYTLAADLYLGDVSSQIYEFLLRPRPCLFVDANEQDWSDDPNFLQWRTGPVIGDVDALGEALDEAFATHDRFLDVQRELFQYSIDLQEEPSSLRAARSLLELLES